jgi:putative flippase GtrA
MRKFAAVAMSLDYRIKFVIVGGVTTLIGVSVYWIILVGFGVNLFANTAAPIPAIIIATTASQTIGLFTSFLGNKFFTFQSRQSGKSEIVKFISVYLFTFAMDCLLKYFCTRYGLNQIVVAIISVVAVTILSFVGQ